MRLPAQLTLEGIAALYPAARSAESLDASDVEQLDLCGAQLLAWCALRGIRIVQPSPAVVATLQRMGLSAALGAPP